MVLDQNVFAPEVLADGFGGGDAKRLTRAINQIGEGFKFTHKPKPTTSLIRLICH